TIDLLTPKGTPAAMRGIALLRDAALREPALERRHLHEVAARGDRQQGRARLRQPGLAVSVVIFDGVERVVPHLAIHMRLGDDLGDRRPSGRRLELPQLLLGEPDDFRDVATVDDLLRESRRRVRHSAGQIEPRRLGRGGEQARRREVETSLESAPALTDHGYPTSTEDVVQAVEELFDRQQNLTARRVAADGHEAVVLVRVADDRSMYEDGYA